MSISKVFASFLMTCLLAVGFLSVMPTADTAQAGQLFRKHSYGVKAKVVGKRRLVPGQRPVGPIVPYIAYDYPYYYNRGFFPTHIGPGYVYINYHVVGTGDDDVDVGPRDSALDRCFRKYKSFKAETGLYTTYSGKKKLCPFLAPLK